VGCEIWAPFVGQAVNGQYRLTRVLGCGAFGGVFLADEMLAGRQISEVAVKLISPPSGDPDEQMRELIAMRNLNHPHVARGLSVGQCTLQSVSLLYVVMDVAEGTLGTRLSQGVLDGAEAEELTLHVCEGLEYLHARRVTHRDLKPANVLRASGGWQLSDLGLIREMKTLGSSAGPPRAARAGWWCWKSCTTRAPARFSTR
jgi:serine/threonine protein kinase